MSVVRTINPTKNAFVVASWRETRPEPNQNTREITRKPMDWEAEKRRLLQNEARLDFLKGISRLLLYSSKQSSSRVNDATVRMAPAASHARWAEAS